MRGTDAEGQFTGFSRRLTAVGQGVIIGLDSDKGCVRLNQKLKGGYVDKKYTFCRICEACCGFVAELEGNRIVKYSADRDHPVSKGYSCIKGHEMLNIQYHPKRIKFPLKRKNGQFERIPWEQAIEEIGSKLVELKDKYGPHSIGAYLGTVIMPFDFSAVLYSGAFMRSIGTRNIYGPGSQDSSNKFAHSLRFYGAPLTIISPDFDRIDYFLAFGSNPLAGHFTFANFKF